MPALQLAALLPAVTETLLDGLEKLASQLKYAMQQLTMRNNNDAAFTKEARQVCNKGWAAALESYRAVIHSLNAALKPY